jgi:thiol-disulfide isomerase/thioredoxin
MFKKSILVAIVSTTLLFTGCNDNKKKEESIKATKKANNMISSNEFVLTSTNNKEYVIKKEGNGFIVKGAEGKVIIFDIFATWCPPCQASASHLTSLQEKYKDKLLVLGITIEKNITNKKLDEFKTDFNAKYEILNSKANHSIVEKIATSLALGDNFPIPLMALYKDGKLINHYIGKVQEEFIQSDIKRALKI